MGRDFSYAPRRAKKKSTAITRANPTQPAAPDTAYPTGAPHPDPTHSPAHPPPSRLTPYPSPAHHLGPYQLTCPSLPYEKLLGKTRFHTIPTHTLRNALTKVHCYADGKRWFLSNLCTLLVTRVFYYARLKHPTLMLRVIP